MEWILERIVELGALAVSLAALIVAVLRTRDSNRIAREANQIARNAYALESERREAELQPNLVVEMGKVSGSDYSKYGELPLIRNVGKGVALNVRVLVFKLQEHQNENIEKAIQKAASEISRSWSSGRTLRPGAEVVLSVCPELLEKCSVKVLHEDEEGRQYEMVGGLGWLP